MSRNFSSPWSGGSAELSAAPPMAKAAPDSPEAFAAEMRGALLKGFLIPVLLLGFFAVAPDWLDHKLREDAHATIARADLDPAERAWRTEKVQLANFKELCRDVRPGFERMHESLHANGVCGHFDRLRWGWGAAIGLIAVLAGMTTAVWTLKQKARRSRADLISAYRLAWRLSLAAALTKVVLMIPLLGYGSFELTVLATGKFFPKLILVIVIGGVVALWQSASILLRGVAMEFEAPATRAIKPEEAPELWRDVKAAAARLGTAPPDTMLIGMEHNFYVTELAVAYRGGRATGRTLYLSRPLLQQLAPGEVMAIIGHELGHFRGEDTQLTREFYPLRFKAQAMLGALANAGWVAWPSVHSLIFFHGSFAETEQAYSREREFLADRAAAEVTSPGIAAAALIKVHVVAEAFPLLLGRNVEKPYAQSIPAFVREQLLGDEKFWRQLLEQKTQHPLDSHPALHLRLTALGRPAEARDVRAVASTDVATADERWFAGRGELFAEIEAEASGYLDRARTVAADYSTEEGRKILDEHFPEMRWRARQAAMWGKIVFCGIGAAISAVLVYGIEDGGLKVVMAAFFLVCAYPIMLMWRRHRRAEFVLRADGLEYTGWTRPLRFEEIADVSAQSNYGSITVTFHLKEKAPGRWRHGMFNWIPTRTHQLELGLIPGKQQQTFETLMRYLTRQT